MSRRAIPKRYRESTKLREPLKVYVTCRDEQVQHTQVMNRSMINEVVHRSIHSLIKLIKRDEHHGTFMFINGDEVDYMIVEGFNDHIEGI